MVIQVDDPKEKVAISRKILESLPGICDGFIRMKSNRSDRSKTMEQFVTTIVSYGNGIYAIDQQMVRCFVIVGSKEALLLDAGAVPVDIQNILREITDLPITVVLTHRDGDHICNLSSFTEAYAGGADIQDIREHEGCHDMTLHPLTDGQIFDIGGRRLRVISTPGHTPGSICLLDEENKILFSGDTISYGPVYMFGDGRDMSQYVNTLQMLKEMKDEGQYNTVYCCHNICPITADAVEHLIFCANGIMDGTIKGVPTPMHGQTPLLGKDGDYGILF